MDFKNKNFLFVGEFKHCVDRCVKPMQMVEMAGGIVKKGTTVTKNINYLVIGDNGSKSWKNGICPQKEKAKKMQANGQDISIITEKALLDGLKKAGITEEIWLEAFNRRLTAAYNDIADMLTGIIWSYDKKRKTLTIDNVTIPSFLEIAEDANITGYRVGAPKPDRYFESVSKIGMNEYGPKDLKQLLPWAEHTGDMKYVRAPNLIEVPPGAFAWSDNLMRAEFPNARIIRSGAFYECKSMIACIMPKVIFIGRGAFENCEKLQGHLALKDIEHIGNCAFKNCFELTSVSISRADRVRCDGKSISGQGTVLKYVGDCAFSGCTKLRSFSNKNDGTITFGNNAFYNCVELK